jgi:murein DD-endopeptidase MepM/ murein hydrolase activator NlpD
VIRPDPKVRNRSWNVRWWGGTYSYSDDYGAPRYAGGYHAHAGNDVFAPMGTPVVAPFNGFAVKDPNTLGETR